MNQNNSVIFLFLGAVIIYFIVKNFKCECKEHWPFGACGQYCYACQSKTDSLLNYNNNCKWHKDNSTNGGYCTSKLFGQRMIMPTPPSMM